MPEVRYLGQIIDLLFFTMIMLICISTKSTEGCYFFHIHSSTFLSYWQILAILIGVIWYLIVVLFSVSWWLVILSIFQLFVGCLCVFWEMSVQISCPFLNWISWFCRWVFGVPYTLWLCQMYTLQILSPILLVFSSLVQEYAFFVCVFLGFVFIPSTAQRCFTCYNSVCFCFSCLCLWSMTPQITA